MTSPALPDLGVYVHWPFCTRICPYCDFNVYKNRNPDAGAWQTALLNELRYWAEQTPGRALTSLYFGGGTPSLMPAPVIQSVIDHCAELWGFIPDSEITLEANPGDITAAKLQSLKSAGITRLSLGVQSFDDTALHLLGRDHSASQAKHALDLIAGIFDRSTFDLIYGLAEQSLAHWHRELDTALSFGAGHLSLYQLTIEPGTAFDRAVRRGAMAVACEELAADLYEAAIARAAQGGLRHYEISNFARPGHEAKHNLLYWCHQDYIGIGPGAHGRITTPDAGHKQTRTATQNLRQPQAYLASVREDRCALHSAHPLSRDQQMQERFAMGLRLERGIGLRPDDHFFTDPARQANMQTLIQDRFLTLTEERLITTAKGRQLLDSILKQLFVL